MEDILIVGAARTAIGKFGGSLAKLPASDLGALVIRKVLERAGVAPEQVSEVIMGQVLTAATGQNPARQAAIRAGLPDMIPAMTINKVCGHLANRSIFKSAEEHPEQQGMGATMTAVWIDGSKVSIAHVGDSRAYLLRVGSLLQLTQDHSLVAEQVRRGILTTAEAEESDMQSVLLRALGAQPEIEVDAEEQMLMPRDVLLLCSDGLTRMVTEPEIAGTLQSEMDPTKASEKLIALANERGGGDNITVVVVRLESDSKGWFSWLRRGAPKEASGNGSA